MLSKSHSGSWIKLELKGTLWALGIIFILDSATGQVQPIHREAKTTFFTHQVNTVLSVLLSMVECCSWVQERRTHQQNNPLQYVLKESASLNLLGSMKAGSELVMPEIPLRIWCERTALTGKVTCWKVTCWTPIFCLSDRIPLKVLQNLWCARWMPVWLVKWSRIQAALGVAVSKGSLKYWVLGAHSPGDKAAQHQPANSLLSAFSNVHCI